MPGGSGAPKQIFGHEPHDCFHAGYGHRAKNSIVVGVALRGHPIEYNGALFEQNGWPRRATPTRNLLMTTSDEAQAATIANDFCGVVPLVRSISRTNSEIRSAVKGLATIQSTPAAFCSFEPTASPQPVITAIGTRALSWRISRASSQPLIPGMPTSVNTPSKSIS